MSVHLLENLPLFQGLAAEELLMLAEDMQTIILPAGNLLFQAGELAQQLFLLDLGSISLYRSTTDGREKIIEIIRSGEMFAEAVAIVGSHYPVSARANETSQLQAIRADKVRQLIHHNPDMALRMLSGISIRLHKFIGDIHNLTLANAQQKVAGYLLAHASSDPEQPFTLELPAGKALLASRLGLQPETFSRVMGAFKKTGVIREQEHLLYVDKPRELLNLQRQE